VHYWLWYGHRSRVLIAELDQIEALGISTKNLLISETAHVTMPYHRLIDQASEERRGNHKIGTTGRGIGPTYADKSERTGIRVLDLMDPEALRKQLNWTINYKKRHSRKALRFAAFRPSYCD
jgi:adenylosuccinate synthase